MTESDAMKAMEAGVDRIMVSNHGENLDTSPLAVLTLLELHKQCPEIFRCMPVYWNGILVQGTGILKALASGAPAVGLGWIFSKEANFEEKGVENLTGSM